MSTAAVYRTFEVKRAVMIRSRPAPCSWGHGERIAATLFISVPTVERHITHLYAKLGVHSRAGATAYAMRMA